MPDKVLHVIFYKLLLICKIFRRFHEKQNIFTTNATSLLAFHLRTKNTPPETWQFWKNKTKNKSSDANHLYTFCLAQICIVFMRNLWCIDVFEYIVLYNKFEQVFCFHSITFLLKTFDRKISNDFAYLYIINNNKA